MNQSKTPPPGQPKVGSPGDTDVMHTFVTKPKRACSTEAKSLESKERAVLYKKGTKALFLDGARLV